MKMFTGRFRFWAVLPALVTALCLFAAPALAQDPQIDPEDFEKIEAAIAAGDYRQLNALAFDTAIRAVENGMTIQEVCNQIAFVTATTAAALGRRVLSAIQAAVDGVGAAAKELADRASKEDDMPSLELDMYACSERGLEVIPEQLPLIPDEKDPSPI